MGRGGIYFRQTIPSQDDGRIRPHVADDQSSSIDFKEIESGSVNRMVDSSSAALLAEINGKSKKMRIWPWIVGTSLCVLLSLVGADSPIWTYWLAVPLCAAGLVLAIYADQLRKTVVMIYELEPHIEQAYHNLHASFEALRGCSQLWHIESKGNVVTTQDWKVNAGASHLVKRRGITPFFGSPPYLRSNILIPVLPTGRQLLYFFPDRVLVWDTNGVGAVAFDQLEVSSGERRFIEDGRVPRDSQVVDKTWRYVNKKGGPDRRFNNNHEIPIVLYEEILLSSESGLRELMQASRTGIGGKLDSAVKLMASAISRIPELDVADGFIKCSCNNCGRLIEFPVHGVGQTIDCPHCGVTTVLFEPRRGDI